MAALDFPSSPTPGQTYTANGKTWTYDSTTGSWVASNIVTVPISTGVSGLGTGVATALGVNVGSAGAFVVNGGALGTPSSGTLTSCTGLPISTGVSGLGTGVATALGVNIGSAGAPVLFNGAGGTPTSLTLTNATGLPLSTGITGFGANVATFLATPSSANLLSAVTDETGSGALVFGTTPTFTTSALFPDGSASAPSIAHVGDTNCGFWFPAADTIAASTAGSERFRIASDGTININGTGNANVQLTLSGTAPSAGATSYSFYTGQTVPATSTTFAIGYQSSLSTAAATFTCTSLISFAAGQGSIGANSTVTNQYGFYASAGLTGATNNYGFWSGIAAASGRWNFYAAGTADNYFAGNVGIGTTSFGTSASKVLALGNATAPASGPADTLQIYSSDLSAGNTMLSLYTEGTPVNANTTAATTHRIAIRVNGTVYYLLANTAA